VLAAAVVALSLGVLDGAAETNGESLGIGARTLNPLVVLVEVVDLLNAFHCDLELVLDFGGQATEVVVKSSAQSIEVRLIVVLNQ